MNNDDVGVLLPYFFIGLLLGAVIIHIADDMRWENRAIENNVGQYNNKTGKFEWIIPENNKKELDK